MAHNYGNTPFFWGGIEGDYIVDWKFVIWNSDVVPEMRCVGGGVLQGCVVDKEKNSNWSNSLNKKQLELDSSPKNVLLMEAISQLHI